MLASAEAEDPSSNTKSDILKKGFVMIIDLHTHITFEKFPEFSTGMGLKPFKAKTLLFRMDMEGIDKSVVLPLANPENVDVVGVAGNQDVLAACKRHPGRLIPFCNIDPRAMYNSPKSDLGRLMKIYKDLGCKGIGEVCANLPITHPLYKNLFRHAGTQELPVLFHLTGQDCGVYGVIDKFHLPGLEESLREFPDTIFIGHAMAFWSEIDSGLRRKDRDIYPKGALKGKGRLWELLDKYPNLYGDLSAGSGFNAISRDPEMGCKFLQQFHRKLFFGTDRFTSRDQPVPPILLHLKDASRSGKITKAAYEDIMHRNFERVILGRRARR